MLSLSASSLVGFLLLSLGTTSAWADYTSGDDVPTATVAAGVLVGKSTSLPHALGPVNQFLGVPFASPPERFSPPQAAEPFLEPINATEFKPACIQQFRCMLGYPDN
jgi:carboxylesterase type B